MLSGLLMPAVQAVRESARNMRCKSNLRQLGLAVQNYESARSCLPGPWFNAPPNTPKYKQDRGLFVQLLSFIDENSRDDRLRLSSTTFELANVPIIAEPLAVLRCASGSSEPVVLTDMAGLFSGPTLPGLSAATCDYIGNGGYIPPIPTDPELTDGPIGTQIPGSGIPKETVARTSDGLSNTLLVWETIGNAILPGAGNLEFDINSGASPSFALTVYGPPSMTYQSTGTSSTKSYLYSWAGVRLGNIRASSGSVINVGNSLGQPCSRHPGGANAVLLDGSVRLLARDLAPEIGFALASSRGREQFSE